jgi:ankyrin repeat protein
MDIRPYVLSSMALAGLLWLPVSSGAAAAGTLGEDLIKAARKGDRARVGALLQQGAPVDAQDKDGKTALWEAARHDQGEIVGMLVEHGAQVDRANKDGDTPLLQAIDKSNGRVVAQLLAARADPNRPNRDGNSPLLLAAARDGSTMPEALLAAGADPRTRNPNGKTLLMAAAEGGDRHVIGKVIELGADVEQEDAQGETALFYATRKDRSAAIDILLEARAQLDRFSREGMTPLMAAALAGRADAARTLLQAGAQPDLRNDRDNNWTALMYAAKGSSGDIIDVLARAGAHVNAEDYNHETPLLIAARLGGETAVRALITNGAEPNRRGGRDRKTPLDLAVERNDRGVAGILVEQGVCVSQAALDQAAKRKDEKMLATLGRAGGPSCR